MSLLEDNLKAGRPLLQDAVLFRGTRLPDQTSGSYSSETMHGSLLPQVAASYTHNWKQETAFIGAYKVDRESTRFYADFSLEQQLDGKKVASMSVKEAEKFLEPLVRDMVSAKDGRERGRAEDKLESAIKRNLYESNVPTRTAEQTPNRPTDLYVYDGRPDVAIRRAVTMQMAKVGPHNERQVKNVMATQHRNPAVNGIHKLASQGANHGEAMHRALGNLKQIAQRDFGDKMIVEHGGKSLNQMMDAIAKQPLSADQERIGRFAKALVEGANHPNPAISGKAAAIVGELTKLDASSATFKDVAKVSSDVSAKFAGAAAGATKSMETAKSPAPTARAPAAMDR